MQKTRVYQQHCYNIFFRILFQCRPYCGPTRYKFRILSCVWKHSKKPAGINCRGKPRPDIRMACESTPCINGEYPHREGELFETYSKITETYSKIPTINGSYIYYNQSFHIHILPCVCKDLSVWGRVLVHVYDGKEKIYVLFFVQKNISFYD